MTKKIEYYVKLSRVEVAQLKESYPDKTNLLDRLLRHNDAGYDILLNDVTAQTIRREFGVVLYDRLFSKAYALKGERYFSYFLQLQEILRLPKSEVKSILEIGPGYNILRALLELYGYDITTMDVKPEHAPTIQCDLLHMPGNIGRYDLVCAFQVLQHLPHEYFCEALANMCRCSKRYLFISLPCPMNHIFLQFRAEVAHRFFRRFSFNWKWLFSLPLRPSDRKEEAFEGRADKHNPHYWEVNRRSFPKKKIIQNIKDCDLRIVKEFHNIYHPYHWFVLMEKI